MIERDREREREREAKVNHGQSFALFKQIGFKVIGESIVVSALK